MKSLIHLAVILFSGVLISCTNTKKENKEIIQETAKVVREIPKSNDFRARLKDTEPVTKEQFESWLPKTLIDLPLTTSTINMIPGLGSCSGTYNVGNKRIRVMVIDGAGDRGASGVSSYMFASNMDYDEDNDSRYTKTKFIDGVKVKETFHKSDGNYHISMFYGERFAVDIETKEINHNELEQLIKELNLEQLAFFRE